MYPPEYLLYGVAVLAILFAFACYFLNRFEKWIKKHQKNKYIAYFSSLFSMLCALIPAHFLITGFLTEEIKCGFRRCHGIVLLNSDPLGFWASAVIWFLLFILFFFGGLFGMWTLFKRIRLSKKMDEK